MGHGVQRSRASEATEPIGHGRHASGEDWPSEDEKRPAWHEAHAVSVSAADAVEYVPTPHAEQKTALGELEKVPGVQSLHLVAATLAWNDPTEHCTQSERPSSTEKKPGGHVRQADAPGASV